MAIVEMKRVSLLALRADRDRILRTMQRMGCVEITEIQDEQLKAYLSRERGQAENAEESSRGSGGPSRFCRATRSRKRVC